MLLEQTLDLPAIEPTVFSQSLLIFIEFMEVCIRSFCRKQDPLESLDPALRSRAEALFNSVISTAEITAMGRSIEDLIKFIQTIQSG